MPPVTGSNLFDVSIILWYGIVHTHNLWKDMAVIARQKYKKTGRGRQYGDVFRPISEKSSNFVNNKELEKTEWHYESWR